MDLEGQKIAVLRPAAAAVNRLRGLVPERRVVFHSPITSSTPS